MILTLKCCCLSLILKKFQKKSCVNAEVNFVEFAVVKEVKSECVKSEVSEAVYTTAIFRMLTSQFAQNFLQLFFKNYI